MIADWGFRILDCGRIKSLENEVLVDDRSFFDDGRGIEIVFDRHGFFYGDVAFKIYISLDAKGFTVNQRRQSVLKSFL